VVGGKIFFEKKFVFLLDSKRDRRQAPGACGQLADGGSAGCTVLPGWPGRLRRRGRRRLASFHLLSQASCDLRVSSFLLFVFSICLAGIYFFIEFE
jgi:hypothetical protein